MQIYKITNLINDKIYIGKRQLNRKNFLQSRYFGSGKIIKQAIKKYGIENFKREILEECNNGLKLKEREIFWIKKLNSKSPEGYNLTDGGDGTTLFGKNNGMFGVHRYGKDNPMFGKAVYDIWTEKYGFEEANKREKDRNEKHSKHNKKKSECKYCHIVMNIGNLIQYHNKNCKFAPNPIKRKLRKKIECKYCNKKCSIHLIDRWHNENCKLKFEVKNVTRY